MTSISIARIRGIQPHPFIWMLLIFFLAGCGKSEHKLALPIGTTVMVLGDSISAGHGLSPDQAFPSLLEQTTGWKVINAGVSGDTSHGGLARLPDLLARHEPKLVLVELGGNDMLRRVPETEIRHNLEEILARIRAAGAEPVLMATPKPNALAATLSRLVPATFYRELAEANKVFLIEEAISLVLSDESLRGDPLHPNTAGHIELTRQIVAALTAAGYLR